MAKKSLRYLVKATDEDTGVKTYERQTDDVQQAIRLAREFKGIVLDLEQPQGAGRFVMVFNGR